MAATKQSKRIRDWKRRLSLRGEIEAGKYSTTSVCLGDRVLVEVHHHADLPVPMGGYLDMLEQGMKYAAEVLAMSEMDPNDYPIGRFENGPTQPGSAGPVRDDAEPAGPAGSGA